MEYCSHCRQPAQTIVQGQSSMYILCDTCYAFLNSCTFCGNRFSCAFEEDQTVTEPKIIQQQVRLQNGMIMKSTVQNPARIEKTCGKGCPCYHTELGCFRDIVEPNTRRQGLGCPARTVEPIFK